MKDASEDIFFSNDLERYEMRPVSLEDVCYADWVSQYALVTSSTHDRESDDASESDHDVSTTKLFKLPNGRCVRKILDKRHHRIIRYVRFSIASNPEDHFREQVLLFGPFAKNRTCLEVAVPSN